MGGTIWLFSASFLWRKAPGLSFRGAKRRGNLAGPGWITGKFRQNRDCLPEIATAPSGPRNDKSGGLAPLNLCRNHCQPAWRSLSAATFFSRAAALHNERRCLPEIATAPSGPRNDNSGVLAILAAAGTNRSCSAGSGMPLPYNKGTIDSAPQKSKRSRPGGRLLPCPHQRAGIFLDQFSAVR